MLNPDKIWSSTDLPSLPGVAVKLLEMSKDPEAEIKNVVDVIKTDPAISARILKAANSSFFGLQSRVTSVDSAVMLLGTTVVTSLALSFSLVEDSVGDGPAVNHYHAYWTQSIVQAVSAELLSRHVVDAVDSEFFLTGLLADIGRLAMLKTIPDEYVAVLNAAVDDEGWLPEVESEMLGFNHVEIGARLAENWGLPEPIVQAVRHHHDSSPELSDAGHPEEARLVQATAMAALAGEYYASTPRGQTLDRLRGTGHDLFGMSEEEVDEFLFTVHGRTAEAAELLAVTTQDLGDPNELMDQANKQLAELAMQAHAASAQLVAQNEVLAREKQELQSRNQQLQHKAMNDSLTQVYNRYFFDEVLQAEISRCQRNAAPVGLIFTDIDHFKKLNDTYGHQFGDQVLRQVAARLEDNVRKSDIIARYGGEEFVVLAVDTTLDGLRLMAERLCSAVEEDETYFGETRVAVTVSVGGSIATPEGPCDAFARRLVADADAAMYDSKNAGRNQVHVRALPANSDRTIPTTAMEEAGGDTAAEAIVG